MSEEKDNQGENKVTEQPVVSSPDNKEDSADEKSEEALKLEARKAELEEQVRGLEGTVDSLKDDIVRKRQERKGEEEQEQQPVFDKEALLAELEERQEARLKPVLEENEKLRKAVLKSNEDALKAKKQALESINARIASATAANPGNQVPDKVEDKVELDKSEAEVAQIVGLKNPRYMKEVEVL